MCSSTSLGPIERSSGLSTATVPPSNLRQTSHSNSVSNLTYHPFYDPKGAPMKNPVWTLVAVVVLSISSALVGGLVSISLYGARHASSPSNVLRIRRLELVDDRGTIRAALSVENNDDVALTMFSSDSKPMISLGVLAQTEERKELVKESGSPGVYYPAPFLHMNSLTGRETVGLSTGMDGNGVLSFSTQEKTGKVRLGFFGTDDAHDGIHKNGMWGLLVNGRGADGLPRYSGIGMENHDGIDGAYVIPHPPDKTP
jgi:hypothetical protein